MGATASREVQATATSTAPIEDGEDNRDEQEEQESAVVITKKDVAEAEEWVRNSKPEVRVMVIGKTGTGKSTLLNGVLGAQLFEEGEDFEPQTLQLECKKVTKAGVDIVAFDTPGLQDGLGNEKQYLAQMKAECTNIHLILYCVSMLETRSDLEKRNSAIKLITQALEANIWKNAVLILTFANVFEKRLVTKHDNNQEEIKISFKKKVNEWKGCIRNALYQSGVPYEIYSKISLIPVSTGNEPHLITQRYWLSNFWSKSLLATKKEAQVAIMKMSLVRLQYEDDIKPEDFDRDISKQPIVVKKLDKGIAVGAAGVGLATGATTGALIGALAIGVISFGVAAGVGLALGALIGGGVGASSGAGAGLIVALYRRNKKKKKMEKLRKEAFATLGEELAQKTTTA